MKLLYFLIFLATSTANAQLSAKDVLGSWTLVQHLKDGVDCAQYANITYTFRANGNYEKDVGGGYVFKGKWKIEGDHIVLYETQMPNGRYSTIYDRSMRVELAEGGKIHFWEYVCMDAEPPPGADPGPFMSVYERVE